ERLRLAEEEVAQASERFTNGVAGNIEVITAQSSLLRARDTEIDARFTLAAARVALARAAGIARQLHCARDPCAPPPNALPQPPRPGSPPPTRPRPARPP